MKISFAICTHNETDSLEKLLQQLTELIDAEHQHDYEIVIVDDNSTNTETVKILEKFSEFEYIRVFKHSLNGDFAAHKNYLNSMCLGEWIFNIDADEILSPGLAVHCYSLIESNPDTQLFWIPRVNIVNGITLEHVMKWGWKINFNSSYGGSINFPDLQGRLYRRMDKIRWVGKVHERIEGAEIQMTLPFEEFWSLIHIKNIERQAAQNMFYENL